MTATCEEAGPQGPAPTSSTLATHSDSTADRLVTLGMACAELIDELADAALRSEQDYNRGWADCMRLCRSMFNHGVDVGRRQVVEEITAEQAETNARLSGQALSPTAQQLERIRFDPEHLTAARRCVEDGDRIEDGKRVTGRCKAEVRVDYRVRDDLVRCHKHRPTSWCGEHLERDSCGYAAHMDATRHPEYTGGPVPPW